MKKTVHFLLVVAAIALLAACDANNVKPDNSADATQAEQAATTTNNTATATTENNADQQQNQAQGAPVAFLIAQTEAGEGLQEIPLPDGSIWLNPEPALTHQHLDQVGARQTESKQPFVLFQFNQAGSRSLQQLMQRNQGKLLVTAVGDQIIGIVAIDGVIDNGMLGVQTSSDDESKAIVDAISGKQAQTGETQN